MQVQYFSGAFEYTEKAQPLSPIVQYHAIIHWQKGWARQVTSF